MDDISVAGGSQEDVLHKMKYMEVKTGKKKEEDISERVKSGNIQWTNKKTKTNTYEYQ